MTYPSPLPIPPPPNPTQVLVSHVMELSRMSSYFVAAFRWLLTDDLTEAQQAQRVLGTTHLERPGVRARGPAVCVGGWVGVVCLVCLASFIQTYIPVPSRPFCV